MTEEEIKAKELIEKFAKIEMGQTESGEIYYMGSEGCGDEAKQCAIICCDEILNVLFQHHEIDSWQKVKKAILKQ